MFHSQKKLWLALVMLLAGVPSIFGFSYLGPVNEPYQVNVIGYGEGAIALGDMIGSDVGAPKNFNQGYRWNTPTNYYAYDSTFLAYFGSNGVTAVDQAFAAFNNLTNASSLNLSDWPLQSTRFNAQASALFLLDLKSQTMHLIIEQLGLAPPDRYTWALHDRFLPGGAQCPAYSYLIIQRNFDPATYTYSSFVNGVLYGYEIVELCPLQGNPLAPFEADAIEIPVDPTQLANEGSAVAAGFVNAGGFYTSFTKDDIGGLKALYSAANVYVESADTNSLQVVTNQSDALILVTSNLSVFSAQALTNSGPALQALYPTLVIVSNSVIGFSNVVSTNLTAVLSFPPNAPAGFVQVSLVPVLVTNIVELFSHTYANLEIVHTNVLGTVTNESVTDFFPPNAPAGQFSLVTNFSVSTFTTTDYYILPTNLCGPYQIISTQMVQPSSVTNFLPLTIAGGVANANTNIFFGTQITSFNQFSLLAIPVECQPNFVALREGAEKISFVRQDFDSLLGRAWTPVTNKYHLTSITNGVSFVDTFQRVLTVPDIILSAADLTAGPSALPASSAYSRTTPHFNNSQLPAGQPGPGTIQPEGINFVYNSVGPTYLNIGPFSLIGPSLFFLPPAGAVGFAQANSAPLFLWGSFDDSTNNPVVYPSSISIASLQAQIFFQITNSLLANASVITNVGANRYSQQLGATGASPPYTFTLASGSPGLPSGLTLSASGVISGSPTTPGTYDFTVQARDQGARVAQKGLAITVGP